MVMNVGLRLVAASAMLLLVSCATTVSNEFLNENGLLRYVPADSPYVFAAVDPLPDDVLDAWEPKIDAMLEAYQDVIRGAVRAGIAKNTENLPADGLQGMSRLLDEVLSLMSIEGMRGAGIGRESGMVFFGHGLLPVFRIELTDPALFEAAVTRMEDAVGGSLATAELDGQRYRYAGDDKAQFIVAVIDGDAIMTISPGSFGDDDLRQLLGLALPAVNIAGAGTLAAIASEYGYLPHGAGFVDMTRFASTLLDGPTGLDAVFLPDAAGFGDQLSPVCNAEIRDLVAVAPRMVVGSTAVDTRSNSSRAVIELRDDIATGLSTLAGAVPGLGTDFGGLASFGMSFDIEAFITFAESRMDAVEAEPFQCEKFASVDPAIARFREALEKPLPPFIYGLRGFNIVIDSAEGMDLVNDKPPTTVDGSLLVAMDDPEAMLAMGAMFSPELAQLDLLPGGDPQLLSLPPVASVAESAFIAMSENAIAVSLGDRADERVLEMLDSELPPEPTMFGMAVDASEYYALVAAGMMEEDPESEDQLPAEMRTAMRDAMLATGALYDRMSGTIEFTSRGIEIPSRIVFAED